MLLKIPKLCLVVLIGPSGAGKSTFARRHFLPSEVISSDYCRGLVSDDENDQSATNDAFELLHAIVAKRLERGRLTVVDATNVQRESREPLVALARRYHCLPAAIVFDMPARLCQDRNASRSDRQFGNHVVHQQRSQLRRSLKGLRREGFRDLYHLTDPALADAATIERVPLWNDRRDEHGPFDIIGDVHGCADELERLLEILGYERRPSENPSPLWGNTHFAHPQGRKVVFVGDLVDRGPRVLDVVRIARGMLRAGAALCVPGNHDVKLLKAVQGKPVHLTHGIDKSLAEIDAIPESERAGFQAELAQFFDSLISHYVLDAGRVVVAHAGLKQEMQGRASARVRDFALYGETTGETDEFGLPVRYNWAADYRGSATVVYGHTPVATPEWLNGTLNIDTGCVFGGRLTALRYPERELVSVPADRVHFEPIRPLLGAALPEKPLSAQQADDDMLDAADVLGKRIIITRLHRTVTIRKENATAALEVMSRFAINPKWLIYLPPTMSPSETSEQPTLLEHPAEAFAYFRRAEVSRVICQEKHMGSRAVVMVCRDESSARRRFGILESESGAIVTRTGRRFFLDIELERQFLARLQAAIAAAGLWEELQTDWLCLDCELMPWSAKAQELLRAQYAAVGAAGKAAIPEVQQALAAAAARLVDQDGEESGRLLASFAARQGNVDRFIAAYRQYCWPVRSIDDLKLAPFHLLASEGKVRIDQNHLWHMQTLARLCDRDPQILLATRHCEVDLADAASEAAATKWWSELTSRGGEGMVVKPLEFVARQNDSLVQPALKCRGPEYLRIIYGPDYDQPCHLERLRRRGLTRKRSLALREFALGIEALERFANREPLRRVHECVFGVLALESEPIDPRL